MVATFRKHADLVRWMIKEGADTQAELEWGTAANLSKETGASAEQTAYLEAKTHCSNPKCSGAGIKVFGMQAGAVLRGAVPVCPLEGSQGRLRAVERGAQGGHGCKRQVMGVCRVCVCIYAFVRLETD
jgi:hypothetical protein